MRKLLVIFILIIVALLSGCTVSVGGPLIEKLNGNTQTNAPTQIPQYSYSVPSTPDPIIGTWRMDYSQYYMELEFYSNARFHAYESYGSNSFYGEWSNEGNGRYYIDPDGDGSSNYMNLKNGYLYNNDHTAYMYRV